MLILDWNEFGVLCENLSQQIKKCNKNYKYIVGIPRGGLCLAVALSHKLGIQYCDLETAAYFSPDEVLIVDDINDTGKTLSGLKEKGYDTAVLVTRHTSPLSTTFTGGIIENDKWVIMPWECPERAKKDEQQYKSRNIANLIRKY